MCHRESCLNPAHGLWGSPTLSEKVWCLRWLAAHLVMDPSMEHDARRNNHLLNRLLLTLYALCVIIRCWTPVTPKDMIGRAMIICVMKAHQSIPSRDVLQMMSGIPIRMT